MLGGVDPEPDGLDLRGAFVGSEGTMGIATRIAVRLTPLPPTVATLLADFSGMAEAAAAVTGIIAAGIVPAALEMMDATIVEVVEAYVHAGLPTDAAAVLLVEVDGLPGGVDAQTERVRDVLLAPPGSLGAGRGRRRPSGPCGGRAASRPSAPSPASPPTTTSTTAWCHAPGWSRCSSRCDRIARRHGLILGNVFHAGDGNLHPLIVFDRRAPGVLERVHAAGQEIVEVCVAAGGTLSGEHGIGLEKRDAMPLVFSAADLEAQRWLRDAFDPAGPLQPGEGAAPGRLALRRHRRAAGGGVGVTLDPRRLRGGGRRRPGRFAWPAAGPSGTSGGVAPRGSAR